MMWLTVEADESVLQCEWSSVRYDWAILEQTRSSKNRLKVRRFDREGLHRLQYSHTFAVAMSLYQISVR